MLGFPAKSGVRMQVRVILSHIRYLGTSTVPDMDLSKVLWISISSSLLFSSRIAAAKH